MHCTAERQQQTDNSGKDRRTERRTDDFTATWVLVRAALETEREEEEGDVAHFAFFFLSLLMDGVEWCGWNCCFKTVQRTLRQVR